MTKILALTAVAVVIASSALAESRIDALCGMGHANEVAGPQDVKANPAGYYVVGLRKQISLGDPRIVQATGEVFHLCTRSVWTPEIETTHGVQKVLTRDVKYLFIPAGRAPMDARP